VPECTSVSSTKLQGWAPDWVVIALVGCGDKVSNAMTARTVVLMRQSDLVATKTLLVGTTKTKMGATKFKMGATKFRNGATKLFTSQLVLQRGLTGIRSIENEISSQFVLASENFVQANVKFISAICRPFRSAFRPGSFRRCG
jgi:hypothetical protein